MFGSIVGFELRYQLHQRTLYAWLAALALIGYLLAITMAGWLSALKLNAPSYIAATFSWLTLLGAFMPLWVCADAALRDRDAGMTELVRTTPTPAWLYLLARLGVAYISLFLVFLAAAVGFELGCRMWWIDAARVASFRPLAYANAFAVLVFAHALHSGSHVRPGRRRDAKPARSLHLADHHFFPDFREHVIVVVRYLSVTGRFDRSNRVGRSAGDDLALEQHREKHSAGATAWCAALESRRLGSNQPLLLGACCSVARPARQPRSRPRRRYRRRPDRAGPICARQPCREGWRPRSPSQCHRRGAPTDRTLRWRWPRQSDPRPSVVGGACDPAELDLRGHGGARRPNVYFAGILWQSAAHALGEHGDVGSLPVTAFVAGTAAAACYLPLLVIAIFFGGETVWRERQAKIAELIDATPTPSFVFLVTKLGALAVVMVLLLGLATIIGVGYQIAHGVTRIDLHFYAVTLLLILMLPTMMLAVLAALVHVVVNSRFVGHLVTVGLTVGFSSLSFLEIEHPMIPPVRLSDMNGLGHFLTGPMWFLAYWGSISVLLGVATVLLWVRGPAPPLLTRVRAMRHAMTRTAAGIGLLALLGTVLTGGCVYWNTRILNLHATKAQANSSSPPTRRSTARCSVSRSRGWWRSTSRSTFTLRCGPIPCAGSMFLPTSAPNQSRQSSYDSTALSTAPSLQTRRIGTYTLRRETSSDCRFRTRLCRPCPRRDAAAWLGSETAAPRFEPSGQPGRRKVDDGRTPVRWRNKAPGRCRLAGRR